MAEDDAASLLHRLEILSLELPEDCRSQRSRRSASTSSSYVSSSEEEHDTFSNQVAFLYQLSELSNLKTSSFVEERAPKSLGSNASISEWDVEAPSTEHLVPRNPATSDEHLHASGIKAIESNKRRLTIMTLADSSDEEVKAPSGAQNDHQLQSCADSDSSVEILSSTKGRGKVLHPSDKSPKGSTQGTDLSSPIVQVSPQPHSSILESHRRIPRSKHCVQTWNAPYVEEPEYLGRAEDEGAFLIYEPAATRKQGARRKHPLTPQPQDTTSKATTSTSADGKFHITSPSKISRPRKNAALAAFMTERDVLCLELVKQLDHTVFKGQLPDGLVIAWSKRLNTTAGRAQWKRRLDSRGAWIHDATIELSTKVVDSPEKLNNTLSHELAHVMSWIVDREMKPPHGPAFKRWSRKITGARPDITITTRHRYSIAYKYKWECTNEGCSRQFGRHSKSIDPSRQVCGCGGSLKPLL